MTKNVEINEYDVFKEMPKVLDILLSDHSSGKNIVWATNNYAAHGKSYYEDQCISSKLISGYMRKIVKPRIEKSQREQKKRSRDMAEVFTPSWVCNKQNNLIDEQWFGHKGAFNIENEDNSWTPSESMF